MSSRRARDLVCGVSCVVVKDALRTNATRTLLDLAGLNCTPYTFSFFHLLHLLVLLFLVFLPLLPLLFLTLSALKSKR